MIDNEVLVALDIETSNGRGSGSLDPRDGGSFIALVQLAYEGGSIEVRRFTDDTVDLIKSLIAKGHRFVIHNASFELDWLLIKSGIRFDKIWCTMVASQILNAGKSEVDYATSVSGKLESKNLDYLGHWTPLLNEDDENLSTSKSGRFSHTLQATVYRYANKAKIQKDQGNSNWAAELTEEQLRYAKDDVRYLIEVARTQWDFIKKFKMERVAELEMKVAIAANEMKFRGILIDKNRWMESASKYGEEASALEEELNRELGLELAAREGNVSVFGTFVPRAFKVSSATQLARFFGLEKADESVLRSVDHWSIPKILKFKEGNKIASTYGESYLSFITEDGRIHSLLPQTETATGRFKSRKPNLQNIPPEMLKSFLSAGEGKLLVFADYSAMESRILAYAAKDDNFIKSVNSKDVHWENAKKIFGLPENANKADMFHVESMGKTIPGDTLRRMSKGVSFGIPYGISAVGLVNRGFAEDADMGQDLIDSFLGQYPQVARFLKASVTEALTRGYTQDPFGRIRWYEIPKRAPEEEIRQATNRAARQAQNHKIQSMSANITKQAIVDLYDYFNINKKGYMVLTIHDSVVFEIDLDDSAGEVVSNIIRIMEEAGPKVFPGMIVPVDVDLGHKEHRVCRVTGIDFTVYSHVFRDGKVIPNDAWVEPRVFSLLLQRGFDASKDYSGAMVKLGEVIKTQPVEWLKENGDIVLSVEKALSR